LNRVRSSRRLEAEGNRNIELIWLLGGLKPDFKTIADFRRDNRAAFRSVFREFVVLCRRLDLFGRELIAVDGTRIKAVNNKDRNFTRGSLEKFIAAADERLDDYLRRLDAGDIEDAGKSGSRVKNLAEKIEALRKKRGECDALRKRIERTGESQISLTDPDSRAMAAHTKVGVGYNAQIAVEAKQGGAFQPRTDVLTPSWTIALRGHHRLFAAAFRHRTPTTPDRGAAAPLFFRGVRTGSSTAAPARVSCDFAGFVDWVGFAGLAPPVFEGENLTGGEGFAGADVAALVLAFRGG
jgi:Transposase domain (DUF772)